MTDNGAAPARIDRLSSCPKSGTTRPAYSMEIGLIMWEKVCSHACPGSIPVPAGSAHPEAMETAEDAELLATSSSEGDDDAADGDGGNTATADQDASRAAGQVSTLRLAPPEPSGNDQETSGAAALQRSDVTKSKRKDGARSVTGQSKADQNVSERGGGSRSNPVRTDSSTRKKPKRTSANVTTS